MPDTALTALDASPTTLARELRPLLRGELREDPFSRSLYATDASIYEIEPLLVALPLDEDDVRACVWFAAQHGIPLIARGAGSGLTGESLGRAIIMDLNAHMARIIELDRQQRTVVVESGVVLDSLNRALRPYQFRIAPDPASSSRCTLGGMIANNACGMRSLKYGATREHLESCRVVLADGSVTNFRPIPLDGPVHERKKQEPGLAGKINRELPELLARHAELIASRAKSIRAERNRSGYLLDGVLDGDTFDPSRLICASEGTLGVVTEAVLRVVPLPGETGLALLTFGNLVEAARAVPAIRETHPTACELFDAEVLRLGRRAQPEKAHLLPEGAGAMLAVEYEADDRAGAEAQLEALQARLKEGVGQQSFRTVADPREQADLWGIRKTALPLLFQRPDGLQPTAFVEDACVPVDRLAEYTAGMIEIFERHGVGYNAYAHAGHGEPHFRPLLDLTREEHVALLEEIAGECHALVWQCEGTISGEHGEGLARAQWIEPQAGEELYAVYREVKELFDPRGILNPDKKITGDPHLMLKNLRFGPKYRFSDGERPRPASINPVQAANRAMFHSQTAITAERTVEQLAVAAEGVRAHGRSALNWAEGEMAFETGKCNGNAACRSTGPEVGMCPRFKYNRTEEASPRAKANLLRRLLSGRQAEGAFGSDEVIEVLDFCFNCKLCHHECPSAVNIPKLVMEAKARYHQSHALPLDKWFFVQTERFARFGRALAPLVNTLNALPLARWVMERIIGIDRRRPLPRFKSWRLRHRNTFDPQGPRPKAVLYLDLFAKYHAPEVAQAAVDVLEHNGFEVLVPEAPWTNMPALSHGALVEARRNIAEVSKALAPWAFRGYPILVTEPTAALCLRQDFLYYTDTPETRAVARHARDCLDFLSELHGQDRLKTDFRRVELKLGYHQPCQHRALHIGRPGAKLLASIPGVEVDFLDHGCCGIAGAFGLLKKNYDESMWIGRELFRDLGREEIRYGVTESSVCKMQMEHGTGKRTWHPLQVLAAAYGYASALPRAFAWEPLDRVEKEAPRKRAPAGEPASEPAAAHHA